jgi:hypothetical protein
LRGFFHDSKSVKNSLQFFTRAYTILIISRLGKRQVLEIKPKNYA